MTALFLAGLSSSCSSPGTGDGGDGGDPATTEPLPDDTGPVPPPSEDTTPRPDDDADTPVVPELTYPAGPYGLAVGQTFPNLALQGYRDAQGEWTSLSMLDHYDPDGARGITGIYLVLAAQWCGPCNLEARVLSGYFEKDYRDRGAHFLTAVVQDGAHKPATRATVDQWIEAHHIVFDIASDPTQSAAPKGTYGLPYNYVINPRTMKVIRIIPGVDPAIVACSGSASCSAGYVCSPTLKTCLPEGALGPIYGLDAVMIKNGAPRFDTGLGG
ncbi:MAG: redoxin domain-containing protein [Polyangiales bacterium]